MNPRLLRLLSVQALATAFLLQAPTAVQAQYTPLETVAGQFIGRPSCAPTTSDSRYYCVSKNVANVLLGISYNDNFIPAVSPLENLVGSSGRNPSCTAEHIHTDNSKTIVCALVGADSHLYGFAIDSDRGTLGIDCFRDRNCFLDLGGNLNGDPVCVLTEDGPNQANTFATCAAVDFINRLVAIRFNPLTRQASGWQVVGGTVVDNPSCVPAKGGLQQVICAVKGTTNGLFGIRFAPQTGYTSGFKSLGGQFVGSPSCANTGSGTATCVIRDARNALIGIRFNPNTGGKSAFQNLGGTWVGDPSCAPANQGFNRVVCVGRATDNNLEAIRFDPSTGFSSGFVDIPGNFSSDASCAHGTDFRRSGLFCAARRMDNAISLFFVNP